MLKQRLAISLLFKLTQIFNQTAATFRLTRGAHIAAMENKPVVDIHFKLFWYNLL